MKKKVVSILLIILFTGLVLYYSLKDNYELVINTILNINIMWLFIAFILFLVYMFFKSIVMWLMAASFNKSFRFRNSLRLNMETNFFHAITPFASGGQPYEIYSLRKNGIKVADSTNISIECFITYQISLVTLGLFAIISNRLFNLYPSNKILAKLVTIGFIMNLLVIVGLFVLTFATKLSDILVKFGIDVLYKLKIVKDKEKTKERFSKTLSEFHDGARILLNNKKKFIGCILLQFISLISLYLIPFALIMGANITYINPLVVIVTSAYVMLIGAFVPIPGGTGGLEYGFVAFFSNFITGSSVNAIMLVWRFITYYFGMILGAILLSTKRREK